MAGSVPDQVTLELRPYQLEAIESIRQAIREGHKRIVLQLSTGGGKTLVMAKIFKSAYEKEKKAIFICDRIELIEQASARFTDEDIPHGIIQANHERTDRTHRVQIASIQTMARRKVLPAELYCIDEVHSLHRAHIKLMKENPDAIFISLSATPWSKGLGKHFTKLIIVSTPQKLIDEGFLVPMHVYGPSQPDLSKVKIIAGEYEEAGLAEATNTKVLIGNIVETWQKLASDRQTLAFAVNIAHSLSIVEAFQAAGVRAAHLDCYAKSDDREAAIRDLKEGRTQILSSCTLLTKGFDYPGASCAILARPTKSLMLNDQMIGRVLRIASGKDDGALILDHAGNTERHGFVTDERPTELDDGKKKSVKDAKKDVRLPKPCPSCHYLKITAKCPRCGFQEARQAKDVEHVEGKLVLLKGKEKATKVKLYTTEQKEDIYAQLLGYARSRGYKEGWCYYKHKELTGTFPARKVAPKEPTPEILGKIKWLHIRNAKRKDKQASLEL